MKLPKNIVCLELDFNQSIEPEHISNINITSLNLADFNKRFDTDYILNYSVDDFMFSPIDDENYELLNWFLEGIPELLSLAYSPTRSTYEDLEIYLKAREKELNYTHSKQMFENYRKRYIAYAPLGFLEEPDYNYISFKLTDMILDKQKEINDKF